MGGLTVLRALELALPGERYIYLGDTARLPYGTKSVATVTRYALQAAHALVDRNVKALVVACNTASATALSVLEDTFAPLPVFGVVKPGAQAASKVSAGSNVLVLATEGTVAGGAYAREILTRRRDVRVWMRPCPLLVTMAEEGRHDDAITELVLRDYLDGYDTHRWQTVLLGCTHFPVFDEALRRLLPGVRVVDSAATTAEVVRKAFGPRTLGRHGALVQNRYLATDGVARFRRVGRYFLGREIRSVELVDL
jgi:glutamate racemase|tara:strand:+ start:671 stop:1429 length:759 start_codon:yes stop_codon:yes gene_type:complete